MLDIDREETAAKLRGSLLGFTRFFLKYMTQRDFILSDPPGRESHQITICKELTKITRLDTDILRLAIHMPPGYGKTLHVCMWIAWCYTQYSNSNFLYISYSHTLAAKHTSFIKNLMSSEMYKYLFDVEISRDSRAKDHFTTTSGGSVAAFGSSGAITGRDAGLPGLEHFTGAVVIDDPIKPDDAHSTTIRENVIRNYEETIRQRARGVNVPFVYIGQRVHEEDLGAYFINDKDIKPWNNLILKALDDKALALYPEVQPQADLLALQEKSPYVFASQYQQDPMPAGGGIFKPHWIVQLEEYPDIKQTFITADTAETAKSYNDATVFSFWGIYEIETLGRKTGIIGLHWIDCVELRIEPKDLKYNFLDFWRECNRFKVAPLVAAIEKKSTGVTLLSVLDDLRGIDVREIQRTRSSGSKTERFLRVQPYLASKQISINDNAKHKDLILEHLRKITANESHRHDDIADTLADAVEIALIEKQLDSIMYQYTPNLVPRGSESMFT